jgi:hypothetical protein
MLEPRPKNNSQVESEIRAENTHITHTNTIELISFWYSMLVLGSLGA